jgi:hypothetical protein
MSANPSEILPNSLYIGNYHNAKNKELLVQLNVRHILNLISYDEAFPDEFEYHLYPIKDSMNQNVLALFEDTNELIGTAITGVITNSKKNRQSADKKQCSYTAQLV